MRAGKNALKYIALALGLLLAAGIISAIVSAIFGIFNLFGLFGLWAGDGPTTDFSQSYEEISELDIYSVVGEVKIVYGEELRVEATDVYDRFSAELEDGKLSIDNKRRARANIFARGKGISPVITVYLPEDLILDKLSIESGAGKVRAEGISTDEFRLEAGVGACYIDSLNAEWAVMNLGVGEVSVKSADIGDLDLKAGVGRFHIKGRLNGDADIEGGIGDLELELLNEPDDHSFDIEGGIGSIEIDGKKVSKGKIKAEDPLGTIKIDGGIGKISVDYIG